MMDILEFHEETLDVIYPSKVKNDVSLFQVFGRTLSTLSIKVELFRFNQTDSLS